jgi:hypothetical protein
MKKGNNLRFQGKFSIVLGIMLALFSIFLAINFEYKHFYEIMLVGLAFILYPLTKQNFTRSLIFKLYFVFLIFGALISDLIFGIFVGEVWFYNYSSILEYLFLYLLIYPLGGFVMLMSFLFFLGKMEVNLKIKKEILGRKFFLSLSITSIILVFLFAFLKYRSSFHYASFFIAVFTWIFLILVFNLKKDNKISYFNLLIKNPKAVILATLFATYINAILHEYPNVLAQQWVYQNILFGEIKLFGVSIVVLIGWLLLTIFPVSVYYYFKK